jgi:hypothetical protein
MKSGRPCPGLSPSHLAAIAPFYIQNVNPQTKEKMNPPMYTKIQTLLETNQIHDTCHKLQNAHTRSTSPHTEVLYTIFHNIWWCYSDEGTLLSSLELFFCLLWVRQCLFNVSARVKALPQTSHTVHGSSALHESTCVVSSNVNHFMLSLTFCQNYP